MNIDESNKIIAEFMKYEFDNGVWIPTNKVSYSETRHIFKTNELMFDVSWDWLMPVIDRVEALRPQLKNYYVVEWFKVITEEKWCIIRSGLRHADSETVSPFYYEEVTNGKSKIECAHQALVKFILWYNDKIHSS